MASLKSLGTLLVLIALAGCGGGGSSPQLSDGNPAEEVPAVLDGLDDAVMTRTSVIAPSGVDEFAECGRSPKSEETDVVERVGIRGSSITFAGGGSSLYACDKIPDPSTAEDPDLPWGGVWCGVSVGRLDGATLNDPRLDLCDGTEGDVTAFAWVEPQADTKWVAVTDAGRREVYEVAESLPVRVTTTENVNPAGSASFDIEEYAADGSKVHEYTLEAQVAG